MLDPFCDHVNEEAICEKLAIAPVAIDKRHKVENDHHDKEPCNHPVDILVVCLALEQMRD